VQLPHALREIPLRRFHQQMIVVAHQAVPMTKPVESPAGGCQCALRTLRAPYPRKRCHAVRYPGAVM
ncbi:MAG: hypothetical protein MN733_02455, partial [Nitrososphaera sp.]|nr:hypothetical protein [Nitrososphaera sp.]